MARLHAIDGWLTENPDEFELYRHHSNQRWSHLSQLKLDGRDLSSICLWVTGAVALFLGISLHNVVFAIFGALSWLVYGWTLHRAVRHRREGTLTEAIARFEDRVALEPDWRSGDFSDPSGAMRGRATLTVSVVEALRRPDGTLPVLVFYSPYGWHRVLAVRPFDASASAPPESSACCAAHPLSAATSTCSRCGAFACLLCTRPYGGQTRCPRCDVSVGRPFSALGYAFIGVGMAMALLMSTMFLRLVFHALHR